jgi:glycerol kinase
LRDGLGIIDDAAEAGPLTESVADTGGVVFVPAFTGLGSPYWDPAARGAVLGLTRGTTRAHIVRAAVEAMGWQTADVVDAIAASGGTAVTELRVDGGASVMDVLCQFQADLLGVTVRRPVMRETTALGAALLAGLGVGIWASPEEAAGAWHEDASFTPRRLPDLEARRTLWHQGVQRARGWTSPE